MWRKGVCDCLTHKQLIYEKKSLQTVKKGIQTHTWQSHSRMCFCVGENEKFLHEKHHTVCARAYKTKKKKKTHLKPLSVGLHLEDDAGVRFGQSISVRYSFTGHTELHFCQTWAVEEAQRGGSGLVDVTHFPFLFSSCERKYNFQLKR